MTTYGDFRTMLLNALASQEDANYSNDLLYEATCGAIDAVLPWLARPALHTLTGDGVTAAFALTLPDLYRIDAILQVANGIFLERILLNPGAGRRPFQREPGIEWLEYPRGTLYLSEAPADGVVLRVFYAAHWPQPASADDLDFELITPQSALMGILYWACAHCVVPGSVSAAQIGQFKMRVDSGVPTDNPLEQSARFLRALFLDEMSRQPRSAGASS